jgi:hypothetical protein
MAPVLEQIGALLRGRSLLHGDGARGYRCGGQIQDAECFGMAIARDGVGGSVVYVQDRL